MKAALPIAEVWTWNDWCKLLVCLRFQSRLTRTSPTGYTHSPA